MNLFSRVVSRALLTILPLLEPEAQIHVRNRLQVRTKIQSDLADVFLLCHSNNELKMRPSAIEPETEGWIRRFVSDGDVLFDIGASVGPYAMLAAKRYPSLTAIAFEPSFTNFHSLCRNILLNELGDRVFPVCAALSDRTYIETFSMAHTTPGPAGHHLLSARENNPVLSMKETRFASLVAIYSLDDFLGQMSKPIAVQHLKIDVDGLDLKVLQGATNLLAHGPVQTVCVEVNDQVMTAITSFMQGFGFVIADNPMGPRDVWNIVFVR